MKNGIVLILGIALAITLSIVRGSSLVSISHDDGISYLSATCHQELYETEMPAGKWVPANQWQFFWELEKFGCFSTIAKDLATQDIHPPLYFWVLHIWSWIYGVSLSTGLILNILFNIFTFLGIFIACRILQSPFWISATFATLWLLNSELLSFSIEARQYNLLGTISIYFVISGIRFFRKSDLFNTLIFCLISFLGLLTHYHFLLLLTPFVVLLGYRLFIKKKWHSLILLFSSLIITFFLFYLIHPNFYMSFIRQADQAGVFAFKEVPYRIFEYVIAVSEIFIPIQDILFYSNNNEFLRVLLIIGLSIIISLVLFWCVKIKIYKKLFIDDNNFLIISSVITTLIIGILYILCFSPFHAMGVKYLILVSPILYVVSAKVLFSIVKIRQTYIVNILIVFLIIQGVYGIISVSRFIKESDSLYPFTSMDINSPVVIDSVARGVLPVILWNSNKSQLIFASNQESLLSKGLPKLPETQSILYLSDLRYGNTLSGQQRILKAFAEHCYSVCDISKAKNNIQFKYNLCKITTKSSCMENK